MKRSILWTSTTSIPFRCLRQYSSISPKTGRWLVFALEPGSTKSRFSVHPFCWQ